jgi:acetyltransferase-like isoleucine patch superfamily enzyme
MSRADGPARAPSLVVRALRFGLKQVERPFRGVGRGLRWHLFPYLRSCYLTLRYVDEWSEFPAVRLLGPFPFRIYKEPGAQLSIRKTLRVNFFPGANTTSMLYLCRNARLEVQGTFEIGEDVRINLGPRARLEIGGRKHHTFSGMPGRCTVYVKERMRIGEDAGFSWKTLAMDSDWHPLDGKLESLYTEIGDHVWICPNAHVLKGARLGADCIVATGSVVLAGEYAPKSLVAGTPAKRIGTAPEWRFEWNEP